MKDLTFFDLDAEGNYTFCFPIANKHYAALTNAKRLQKKL
jgi:hypothetical protein